MSGRVGFSGRDLVLHADQSGERTRAAIESIKVVSFDLAALGKMEKMGSAHLLTK